jgi:O-antigen ligase
LSELLAGAGLLIAATASAAAILLPPGRARALAMLTALVLFPVLIFGDQWHTAQIVDLRHDTPRITALLAIAAAAICALAALFRRWPVLLPLAIVFALPFRIPLHAGGDTANLLVPLYLVIAGGVVANLVRAWGAAPRAGGAANFGQPWARWLVGGGGAGAPRGAEDAQHPSTVGEAPPTGPASHLAPWLPRILAAVVVLYALQALYSEDFSKALQNVCFFLIPFTLAYALLRDIRWDRRLLTAVLVLLGIEATVFVLIGSVEYLTRSLFWNDQVIRSNEFHTYFRVNSIFWDPNIYGRYLALVATVAAAAMLWARERRDFALLTVLLGVLWIGLAQTFSQSSYIALLAGLAVLAAIRWSPKWTLAAVAVGAVAAFGVVVLAGGKFDLGRINIDTSGRANLVGGGIELFAERPLWGYGSGSFQAAYRERRDNPDVPVAESHSEPVTVLAEQGLVGFTLYVSLIVVALGTMGAGMWRTRPAGPVTAATPTVLGAGRASAPQGSPAAAPPAGGAKDRASVSAATASRAAALAAFVALLVHTMAYAGFFEDPITWVLLAVGASLAASRS